MWQKYGIGKQNGKVANKNEKRQINQKPTANKSENWQTKMKNNKKAPSLNDQQAAFLYETNLF